MNKGNIKNEKRARCRGRIRAKISGTKERPRLSVFRSNTGLYVQLIDDGSGQTIVSASTREIEKKGKGKLETSQELGKLLAEKAKGEGIETVVFDRGGYQYHGRVRALAEGARAGGLKF